MCIRDRPITFRDSWNQRFRWAKGFYQVFAHYAGGLVKGTLTNPRGYRFACYDMLMTIAPGMLLSIISILFNTIIIVLAATGVMSTGVAIASSVTSVVFCLCNYIVFMFVFGVLTTFVEWDSIRTTTAKKIRYMFTFPFFMLTYIPIALIALVKKAAWKPIRHSISVDLSLIHICITRRCSTPGTRSWASMWPPACRRSPPSRPPAFPRSPIVW